MRLGEYVIMRYAVLIGYSNGRKIVTVATREPTLPLALERAHRERRSHPDAALWIQKVGQTAYRKKGGA